MSEQRLARARQTLPAGYQFGDASPGPGSVRVFYDPYMNRFVRVSYPIDERNKHVGDLTGCPEVVKSLNP